MSVTLPQLGSRAELTPEVLRSMFDYDAESGDIRWKVTQGRCRAGEAAVKRSGNINVLGFTMRAHLLAWVLGTKHLGMHATEEEARDAYLDAKRRLHAGCTL